MSAPGERALVAVFASPLADVLLRWAPELGYRTVLVGSAEQALAELAGEAGRFDVVFSDVVMPGMGGIELAVDIGVEQQAVVSHLSLLPTGFSAPSVSIRRSRARASRDITVPIGTPVISAISR